MGGISCHKYNWRHWIRGALKSFVPAADLAELLGRPCHLPPRGLIGHSSKDLMPMLSRLFTFSVEVLFLIKNGRQGSLTEIDGSEKDRK